MSKYISQLKVPEKETFNSTLFNITNEAIIAIDEDQNIIRFNHGAEHIFGYSADEVTGQPLDILLHPSQTQIHRDLVHNFSKSSDVTKDMNKAREILGRRKDGSVFPAEASIAKTLIDGRPVFAVILRDISEKAEILNALRESEEKYRLLVENASEVFYQIVIRDDPLKGEVVFVSGQARTLTGHDPDEFIRDPSLWIQSIHPDDLPATGKATQEILSGQTKGTRIYRIKHSQSGEYRWMEDRIVPLTDSNGRLTGYQGVARDITESRQAEDALKNNEKRFRALIENSQDVIVLVSADGTVLYESPATSRILGKGFVGRNGFERIHPDDWQYATELFAQLVSKPGTAVSGQVRYRRTDESWAWLEAFATNLLTEPSVQAVVVNYRDVTERRRAEAEHSQLLNMLEASLSEIYTFDVKTLRFQYVSSGALRNLGYSLAAIETMTPLDIKPEFDEVSFRNLLVPLLSREREKLIFQTIHRRADASLYPVEVHLQLVGQHGIQAFLAIILDITERRQTETTLKKLSSAVEQTADPVIITGLDGKIEYVNSAFTATTGFSADEAVGQKPSLLKSSTHSPAFYKQMWETILTGNAWFGTLINRKKDGEIYFAETTITPILSPQGGIINFVSVQKNVTERIQAEEKIRVSEERHRALVEQASDGIFVSDSQGHYIDVNTSGCAMLGYTREEILCLSVNDLFSTEDAISDSPRLDELRAGISIIRELQLKRKDGTLLPVEISAKMLADGRLQGIVRDITERRRAEEKIQRQFMRLKALSDIDRVIASSFTLRFNLTTLLEHVVIQLDVDAADVLILDPNLNVLEYAAGHGFHTKAIEKARLRVGEGHAGRAALERRLIRIPNLKREPDNPLLTTLLVDENFVYYYGVPLIVKGKVKGVLEIFQRSVLVPDQEWLDFLQTLAGQCAIAIDNATLFEDLQRSNIDLRLAYDATIEGWSRALDLRDKETEGHTQRVTQMTLKLASRMGMSDADLVHVKRGALLHDMGKLGVPDHILLKPGPLTDEEWILMRNHPQYAYDMLSPIAFLHPALDIPYCHHEKWDGTGYPNGIKGEAIPLAARIFAAVDIWDALRSDRPYRPAWTKEKTLEHIKSLAGTHLDPKVAQAFLAMNRGE